MGHFVGLCETSVSHYTGKKDLVTEIVERVTEEVAVITRRNAKENENNNMEEDSN